jgi:hypothetical protein
MSRPENPIIGDGPVAELARALRQLRDGVGRPSYRVLAKEAHYSPASLADATDGYHCPTWDLTQAFVRACGGAEADFRPLWTKADMAYRKKLLLIRSRRARDRINSGLDPKPGRRQDFRDLIPGEPHPRGAITAAQYVRQLRALRAWAGQPGHKEIMRQSGRRLSSSTMYDALSPTRTRLPPLDVVETILAACASAGAVAEWVAVWRAIRLREFERDNPPVLDNQEDLADPPAVRELRKGLRVIKGEDTASS